MPPFLLPPQSKANQANLVDMAASVPQDMSSWEMLLHELSGKIKLVPGNPPRLDQTSETK